MTGWPTVDTDKFRSDTAPWDGKKVVLYREDWLTCPIARWEVVEGSDENGEGGFSLWVLDDENGGAHGDGMLWPEDDGEPTHWTALPRSSPAHPPGTTG